MVYQIDKVQYDNLMKDGRFTSYSGIFVPELIQHYQHNKQYYRLFFNKGKQNMLRFKDDNGFFEESIKIILEDLEFLNRNIISVTNSPITESFCKIMEIDYFFDPKLSENLWTHRSNDIFIRKYQTSLTRNQIAEKIWSQFKYLTNNQTEKTIRVYIYNEKDQITYNSHVAGDTLNSLQIPFSFGSNKTIMVVEKKRNLLRSTLSIQKPKLLVFRNYFNFL